MRRKLFTILGTVLMLTLVGCGDGDKKSSTKASTPAPSEIVVDDDKNNETPENPGNTEDPSEDPNEENPGETPSTQGSTPVDYYGEMLVKDGKIVGSKTGEVVRATGMSFFWSCWSQKYYTADYVDMMVDDYNCEIVRCSYGIQDSGIPHDYNDEPLIDDVIDQCIERGIYVIIDWHSHGAHNNPDESAKYFGKMAEKYGQYDNVIFELFNEPTNISWKTVKDYAEAVIPAIRAHSDNLIVVGNPQWSQKVEDAANDPIDDPNTAYTLHFYAGTHKQWLRDSADRAMAKGIALFVTEWGSVNADGNGAIDEQSTKEWFEWMDKHQLSSCNWAINDKAEGSSIFSQDSTYSKTGEFIKEIIKERTENAPWR